MLRPYKECRGCRYWNKNLQFCDYADKTGKLRVISTDGDFDRLMNEPCKVREPGKRYTRAGEAWRGGLFVVMPQKKRGQR